MKHVALACALSLVALPSVAEDEGDVREGFNLLEEGTRLLLRGLMDEVEPTLRDFGEGIGEIEPHLREFAEGWGPMFDDLGAMLGDLNAYHPPERLPNGDIILRRKVPVTEPRAEKDGQIEL